MSFFAYFPTSLLENSLGSLIFVDDLVLIQRLSLMFAQWNNIFFLFTPIITYELKLERSSLSFYNHSLECLDLYQK